MANVITNSGKRQLPVISFRSKQNKWRTGIYQLSHIIVFILRISGIFFLKLLNQAIGSQFDIKFQSSFRENSGRYQAAIAVFSGIDKVKSLKITFSIYPCKQLNFSGSNRICNLNVDVDRLFNGIFRSNMNRYLSR